MTGKGLGRGPQALDWQVAGVSVVGVVHQARSQVCQDSVGWHREPGLCVMAVADGHGNVRHAMSEQGARIAVTTALELFGAFGRRLRSSTDLPLSEIIHSARHELSRELIAAWNLRIRVFEGHSAPRSEWAEDLVPYGTTLIVGVLTSRVAVFWQLGDGAMVTVDDQDRAAVVFPEKDPTLQGTQTWSLCNRAAWKHIHVAAFSVQEGQPRLVLGFTDGLSDSLGDDPVRWGNLGRWYLRRIREGGWAQVYANLEAEMRRVATEGVGDDTSIVMAWQTGLPAPQTAAHGTDHADEVTA